MWHWGHSFLFSRPKFAQVFPLKPAPFCKLFTGLGSTNKSATSLLFSSYLTLVLSSPLCSLLHLFFYLNFPGRSGRNCFLSPSVLSSYNESLDNRFSRKTMDAAKELVRRGALLVPSVISCSLSLLISRIHFFLFSDWRRIILSKFFDT